MAMIKVIKTGRYADDNVLQICAFNIGNSVEYTSPTFNSDTFHTALLGPSGGPPQPLSTSIYKIPSGTKITFPNNKYLYFSGDVFPDGHNYLVNLQSKDFIIQILKDNDPKIVCQAIRALLVFKDNKEIAEKLKKLRRHRNEMVQSIIEKEFYSGLKKQSKAHHTQTYNFLKDTVVHGDVRDVLKAVPEDSIHLTFTSPPYYNARDYSIYSCYQDYLEFLDEVFKEVHRVTKEGRFLLINTSPIIIPRISRQHSSRRYPIPFDLHSYIVNAGWEYLDDIIWLKPETSVKNRVGGFQQHRKPLGYKANRVTEMIMVYRKKTTKLLDWNIRQYPKEIVEKSKVSNRFETTNVWKIDPVYSKNHTAVFPIKLCKKVIEYYSFEGDLVFDPFGGSGTFGRAAKALNRRFFLTELNDAYFEYMKSEKKPKLLFNELETKFLELQEFKKFANDTN